MYAWLQGGGDCAATTADIKLARKGLRASIDAAYDLYFQMLWLVVAVRDYAAERIELGRAKHLPTPEERNPNMRFVENRLIASIANDEAIAGYLKKHKLGWEGYPELVKELYGELVGSGFYGKYMSGEDSFAADVKVVRQFYSAPFLEDSELLEQVLEEQSSLWNDDAGFAIMTVVGTLERVRDGGAIPVLPEFKDPVGDPAFAEKLLVEAIDGYGENLKLVEEFSQNWDVDRIALMDSTIMTTATAELCAFEDIPARVTLDEYIEIAKYYSTPGSNQFINGILDKIAKKVKP